MGIMRHHGAAKDLKIELVLDSKLPTEVRGDSVRLRQVLSNLVSNALKFTHEGFVRLEVLQRSRENNIASIDFVISDSGVGIAAGELDSIFEPFRQGDSSTTKRYAGVGLGLALVNSLVKSMGGNVDVRSTVGVGSVFIVNLAFECR
jgi:signal transduction histidine kinase